MVSRPEQLDNMLLDLVRKHNQPVSAKTLHYELQRQGADSRTQRSVSEHLSQLVASGALRRIGAYRTSRYTLGAKEQERQRANGRHAPAHLDVDERPPALPAHTIERPDVSQHATLVDRDTTTTTDAQASSEVVAQQASSQVEHLVDQVLARIADALRPALVEVVEQRLTQLSADCDEALRIAEQAQADLAAYRTRVKALLSED